MLAPSPGGAFCEILQLLIIEESESVTARIAGHVERTFNERVRITTASGLSDALQILDAAPFDLVFLSFSLADCPGFPVFHRLRQEHPGLTTVVMIEDERDPTGVQAIREGAHNVLVRHRPDGVTISHSISMVFERLRRIHAEREISAAQAVQSSLYPVIGPMLTGYDLFGLSSPAEQTCGDYFDYIPLVNESVGLVVGDVSGHGLGPALMMSQTRAYLRALCDMWIYVNAIASAEMNVGEVLTHANRLLCQGNDEHFVTMFFAQLEPHHRRLTYASAGHRGYLLKASGETRLLESTGLILGTIPGVEVGTARAIDLEPGDLFFVPTDGIEETMNPDGRCLGVDAVLQFLHENRSESARDLISGLVDATADYRGTALQRDDITAILLKVD